MTSFRLAIIFLFLSMQLNAQSIDVSGVIFQKGSSIRISGAQIVNLKSKTLILSNGMGVFKQSAFIGDTLNITKEGYADFQVVISSNRDLVIQLAKSVQLEEVNVTAQTKKQELDEIRSQYRKKGSYYGGKPPLLSYIFTPITALYELIGKTPGQARRFNRYYFRELEQSEIDRRFNSFKVKPLTDYEGKDLQNFLDTYRPSYELLSKWTDYDLVKYIKQSAIAFDVAGRPAAVALPPLQKDLDLGGN